MEFKKVLPVLLAAVFLLAPAQAMAVDFEITEVQIEAQLNRDGTADVTEQHVYEFDDDFEGITRSLIEKKGTSIEDFTASENGNALKVEKEDNLYKVYRAGDDETIQVELQYRIIDAVQKFEDGAEFYWSFFDDSNESEYGDMTISVVPPAPASDVAFLGYDEAYGTGSVNEDGTVVFYMEHVPDEEKANIRAIFEPELFPDLTAQNGSVRNEIAADREQLEHKAAVFAQNQQTAKRIGIPAVSIFGAILLLMYLMAWLRARNRKRHAAVQEKGFSVPKEKMSIPALLYFTNSAFLSPNAVASALLELVRKGHIEQLSEEHFRLVRRQTDLSHETALVELLFDRIGDGSEFTLPEVEDYTKKEANHTAYNESIAAWNKGIADEVKAQGFHEKQPAMRWTAGVLSAVFIGLAIYTGIYELFPWMAASIALSLLALGFAIGYSPITLDGHELRRQWRQLKKNMENLPEQQWNRLNMDDKQRAYAYLLGTGDKAAEKKAASFASAASDSDFGNFAMSPLLMTTVFVAAGSNTSAHASGGSSSAGTGVGGGGGGSGAF